MVHARHLGECLAETLVEGIGPAYALGVRDGYVYYASYQLNQLWRMPADGGTTTTLGAFTSPASLTIDGNDVYIAGFINSANGAGIGKIARDAGGGGIASLDPSLGYCRALATDGTSLYGLCGSSNVSVVRRGPAGNQTYVEPATYASATPQQGAIAVDATHVYWTTPLLLRRANKDLSNPTTLANLEFTGELFVNLALGPSTIYARTSHSVLAFPKTNPFGDQIFAAAWPSTAASRRSSSRTSAAHSRSRSKAITSTLRPRAARSGGFTSSNAERDARAVQYSVGCRADQQGASLGLVRILLEHIACRLAGLGIVASSSRTDAGCSSKRRRFEEEHRRHVELGDTYVQQPLNRSPLRAQVQFLWNTIKRAYAASAALLQQRARQTAAT